MTTKKSKRNFSAKDTGGCFVVRACYGRWWSGTGWVSDRGRAQRFTGSGDPWQDAEDVAEKLRSRGHTVEIEYVLIGRGRDDVQTSRGS